MTTRRIRLQNINYDHVTKKNLRKQEEIWLLRFEWVNKLDRIDRTNRMNTFPSIIP